MTLAAASACTQQPQNSADSQPTSSIRYTQADSSKTIEVQNVTYEVIGPGIAGRPDDQRLVLRKTTNTKQVVDEVGMKANTTIEAWPLGTDLKSKSVYAISTEGTDPVTRHGEIVAILRGLEDVQWWSVYTLGTGQHLFDTHVPVAESSISREVRTMRYVGLEVPPDDVTDSRLKAPNVVGVLIYASSERVLREVLITNEAVKAARIMRSYFDSMRTVEFDGSRIRISITEGNPSTPKTATIEVPVTGDDLDLKRTKKSAGIQLASWQR